MGALGSSEVQQILQASRIGVWKIEFEEGKTPRFYADAVMDELLGTTEDMTAEDRFLFHRSHVHPEDLALFLDYSEKLSEERTEIVYRYLHPKEGEMYVRCGGRRDTSEKRFVCVVGIHKDISGTIRLEKDKQAEQRLAELNSTLRKKHIQQRDYYKNLLDIQNCGVMSYTLPEHRIIHMNAEALRMYGFSSIGEVQERLGEMIAKVYYPKEDTVERLKNLRKVDDTVDYDCIINKGTDKECHVMAKTKVVMLPSGERTVVTTFLDVSDMVMLKNALRQAEEGNRAKTAFLFHMSHDLRTPMNAIIGYAELMEHHWDEEARVKEYLHKLKGASQFLLSLINNVLEMARIESGKDTIREEVWNANQLNDIIDVIVEAEMRKKHLQFHRSICVQHTHVICDALKIREIFLNLLSNAIKYTPAGGTVTMELKEIPSEREGYALYETTVSDTGIGISEDYLPHIYEAFSREKTSSESGIIGTGLGLSIVKSLVENMGGTITVTSVLTKGTTFTVTIPHKIVEPGEDALQSKEQLDAVDVSWLNGKRILLVEDNELNAEIAMTLLHDAGLLVELASDGSVAVAMVKNAPVGYYDLVLMDIQMPHMDGYQATAIIRGFADARAHVPIIAMTANVFEEDKKASLAAGMDAHIAKPIDVSKMLVTMASVLRKRTDM